jgi:hypothetical protein
MPKGQSLQKRFDDRVNKTDTCWIWTGTRDSDGYGVIWTKESNNNERATRVSLRLSGIDVPKDKMVLHSCDNPPCVNPNHLSIGTNQQNQIEAVERGLTGNLSTKRMKFFQKMSEEEFQEWTTRFIGLSGKSLANLTTATNWRKHIDNN